MKPCWKIKQRVQRKYLTFNLKYLLSFFFIQNFDRIGIETISRTFPLWHIKKELIIFFPPLRQLRQPLWCNKKGDHNYEGNKNVTFKVNKHSLIRFSFFFNQSYFCFFNENFLVYWNICEFVQMIFNKNNQFIVLLVCLCHKSDTWTYGWIKTFSSFIDLDINAQ